MKKEIIIVKCDQEGFYKQRLNKNTFEETQNLLLEHGYTETNFQDLVYLYENTRSCSTYYVKIFVSSGLLYLTPMKPDFISKPFKILLNISNTDAVKYLKDNMSISVGEKLHSCENFEIRSFIEKEKVENIGNSNFLNSEFDRVIPTTNFLIKEGEIYPL